MARSIDPRRETSREVQRHNETAPTGWNLRRGIHLGQRSCATASKGRTYGSKRSDQLDSIFLQKGAVHIWTSLRKRAMSCVTERLNGGPNASRTPLAGEPERGRGGDGAMLPRLNRQEANMTKLTTRKSTSTKLTDTQLIVLSRAAQREDGAATLPEGMTEKAAQKLAATLDREGARPGDQGEARHAGMEAQRGGPLPCADHHQARPDSDQGRGRSRIGGCRTWRPGVSFDRQGGVGSIGAEHPTPGQQARRW